MKVFARPNGAFFAYERMMALRPRNWPPTTHDAPTLWGRARELCANLAAFVRTAAKLAQRWRIGRNERRDILARLVPVEVLTRTLLIIEAARILLTPEGQRLRAATPQVEPPQPPPAPFVKKIRHMTTIPMPGWHTIAALRPRIDPRVAEREARERREALERATHDQASQVFATSTEPVSGESVSGESVSLLTGGAFCFTPRANAAAEPAAARKQSQVKPGTGSPHDRQAPPHGARGFTVLRWVQPDAETPPPPQPARRRPSITVFGEDSTFDLVGDLAARTPRRAQREDGPGAALARRIDALQRVLANPAPVLRRLVRQLAAMPRDCLPDMYLSRFRSLPWWHGRPEAHNASALAVPLMTQLIETTPVRPPEPG